MPPASPPLPGDVLYLWSGLGYNRGRGVHKAASLVAALPGLSSP